MLRSSLYFNRRKYPLLGKNANRDQQLANSHRENILVEYLATLVEDTSYHNIIFSHYFFDFTESFFQKNIPKCLAFFVFLRIKFC
jgi:hypothetical protein